MTRQQAGVSAEAVAKLVEKWRAEAKQIDAGEYVNERSKALASVAASARIDCAAALQVALATAPPEQASEEYTKEMIEAMEERSKQPQAASGGALDAIKEKIHEYLGSDSMSDCWSEVFPLLASHDQKVRREVLAEEPWAFAIETPGGDMYDGEYAVFGDRRSAEDQVENLNDDLSEDAEQYKVVPLFRARAEPAAEKEK